jgi:predicted metal-dependent peptidase
MTRAADTAAVRTKLEAARTRLILDQPFVGALLLHLPLTPAAHCPDIATDGMRLYFNPGFIAPLDLRRTQFLLAHQALHCALGHVWRRGERSRARWDLACDYAVNIMLADEGMLPPPGALLESRYRGMAAEEIYPLLPVDEAERRATLDSHWFDRARLAFGVSAYAGASSAAGQGDEAAAAASEIAGDAQEWDDAAAHARRHPGAPTLIDPMSADELAQRWQMRLAMAAQQASRAGRLSTSFQRLLGRMLQPVLPWHALLARHVIERARDDYSLQRPSRREGDAVLPRLHSGEIDLVVVIDTSGSIGAEQLGAFAAEIDALKGQARARVTLHACDERMAADGPWVFEPWQPIVMPGSLEGGGGTDFRPAFEWVEAQHARPDLLVYFTDAEGEFPPSPPPYPVIWLVKGPASVPWGERIQLN